MISLGKDSIDAFIAEGGLDIVNMVATVWKDDGVIMDIVDKLATPDGLNPLSTHRVKCSCSVQ